MAITGLDIYRSVFSWRVLPPAEVWDKDIVQGQPAPIAASVGINPVSYLIQKSRLFQISSEICNPVLTTGPDDPTALYRLDAAIRAELDPLEQSYALMLGGNLSFVHTNLLLSSAHHLVLILHSIILNEGTFRLLQHSWSNRQCMKSAQRVLELHADFHQLPQSKPFYWYIRGRGAFHAFHAASSRWMTTSGMAPDGLHSAVSQGDESNSQNPISQPVDLRNGHTFASENVDFPSLVRQIEPQQWINPVNMDWGQWDLIMNSMGTTS
ncbi:hypothetical protein N7447_006821 [Penicillium robsamsonii]|uniref:uncharacterized protein n=1 Tax=Penicillium robsamsonii TaxID=1792511 RepID=UPI00254836FA|nr:uncharacterized protein N7447_006821 [Penicillium robsamsonii]KAJ5824481.1 hypothetical protein N7447_006821 [Penicillium robsamsonii]